VLYVEHAPAPDLRPWVDRYWSVADEYPAEEAQPVLPDGHPEWVIHLAEPFANQGTCLAIGQMTAPVWLRATGPVRAFGIRFRPEGAQAFMHEDQSRFTGRILDLSPLAPRWREQAGNSDPVSATDALLRLLNPAPPDLRVRTAVGLLASGASVDATARECNWSPRQLERTILTSTGLLPKMLARIGRFQRAMRLRSAGRDWVSVAAEAGFADQSHLIRDFRQFAGAAPSSLRASALTGALVR
jgi:AraC-like DNA-binding protein